MTCQILTQDLLKELIHYEPLIGIFTRLKSKQIYKIGLIKTTPSKWGYFVIYVLGKQYKAHRLAWLYMTGKWPNNHIDHINRNKIDNRFLNLREADDSNNNKNMGLKKVNTSGYKGVHYYKARSNWMAAIRADGKRKFLGYVKTAKEAGNAYDNYAKANHGEFYYKYGENV